MKSRITRRITSGRYNWYSRRYGAMLRTVVLGALDKGDERTTASPSFDELMSEAHKALLYALIHYDPAKGVKIQTYTFARLSGYLQNVRRQYARQVRKIKTTANEDLSRDFAAPVDDPVLRAHVNEVLRCLGDLERQVIVRSFMWDKTTRQIAAELGISHDTVWRLRERAKARLRERYPSLIVWPESETEPEPGPEPVAA